MIQAWEAPPEGPRPRRGRVGLEEPVLDPPDEVRQLLGIEHMGWHTLDMSPTEGKVTALAVATWGAPFALLMASWVVLGPGWSPAQIASLAGANALCWVAVHSRSRLRRRLPPALYRRYSRASELTLYVSIAVANIVVVARIAAEGERGDALSFGLISALILFVLRPSGGSRAAMPRSPDSA